MADSNSAVKNRYDYEELLACARGELFGPGNAQLPAPPMLLFDRITSITRDGGKQAGCDRRHGGSPIGDARPQLRPPIWSVARPL